MLRKWICLRDRIAFREIAGVALLAKFGLAHVSAKLHVHLNKPGGFSLQVECESNPGSPVIDCLQHLAASLLAFSGRRPVTNLDRLWRNSIVKTFFPCRQAAIPREQETSSSAV